MGFIRNTFKKIKKVFGGAPPESDRGHARITSIDSTELELEPSESLDIGPAKRWYVKRLFHRSIFTKKLTPSREKEIREVFRRLRPEQRAIALRRNWTRGLDV